MRVLRAGGRGGRGAPQGGRVDEHQRRAAREAHAACTTACAARGLARTAKANVLVRNILISCVNRIVHKFPIQNTIYF